MIKNINKTKFEQIGELIEKNGHVLDSELFKIWGDETGLYKAQEHIRRYKKLQADRNFFSDKKIIEKRKSYRCHIVRIEGQEEHQGYKIGKDFYKEIDLTKS